MPRVTAQTESAGRTIIPRFHTPGNSFTGLLLSNPEKRRAKDIEGNEKTWPDGNPVWEYVYEFLNVETTPHAANCHFCSLRDGEDDLENDNGFRRLYASGKQHKVMQEAIRAAKNADGLNELYGPLTLTYESDDKDKKQPGRAAPKVYSAKYAIPTDEEVARVDAFNAPRATFKDEDRAELDSALEDKYLKDEPAKAAAKSTAQSTKKLSFDGLLATLNSES